MVLVGEEFRITLNGQFYLKVSHEAEALVIWRLDWA